MIWCRAHPCGTITSRSFWALLATILDPGFFVHCNGTLMSIYMVDGLVVSKNPQPIEDLITQIEGSFNIKLTKGTMFVGMEITTSPRGFEETKHEDDFGTGGTIWIEGC